VLPVGGYRSIVGLMRVTGISLYGLVISPLPDSVEGSEAQVLRHKVWAGSGRSEEEIREGMEGSSCVVEVYQLLTGGFMLADLNQLGE